MMQQRADGNHWLLALTLLLCLGLALVLATLVSASEDVPAPQAIAAVPGATHDWWTGVQARLQREGYDLSMNDSADWTNTGENDNDLYGYSVAGAGDVNGDGHADVIIGAYGHGPGGAAFVYHGSTTGLATTAAVTLTAENAGDIFGIAVASAGDVNGDGYADAIVGAPGYGTNQGAAYLYLGSATGLAHTPALTLTGESNLDRFGDRVAGAGDVNGDGYADTIIGAPDQGSDEQGSVYIYHGSAAGLVSTPALTLTGNNNADHLGDSVAGLGDVNSDGYADAIVGAYGYGTNQGLVHIYLGSDSGLAETPALTLTGENDNDYFGKSVAGAGDVNGDGYADAIIGAYRYPSSAWKGAAYIYNGSSVGLANTPALTLAGDFDGDYFGRSVAGAGDLNGDGYADAIIGAYGYDSTRGMVYIYHGSDAGLATTPVLSVTGEHDDDRFGWVVAGGGDVNGDGYADAIVGAYNYLSGSTKGAAYAYHGSAAGLATTPDPILTGRNNNDRLGYSVASAGDVNGDGYADAIVGAYGTSANQGAAYVHHGSAAGLVPTPALTLTGETDGDFFGASVAGAGDVNGDGYADAIVGAWGYGSNQGAAYIYLGSDTGLAGTPALTLTGENDNDLFGHSVTGGGDVNGDGYADAIVGAHRYPSGSDQGAAYIYHGSPAGLMATPALTLTGVDDGDHFGYSVAGAGDVNGNGYADAIVGAYGHNLSEGAAYVFFGSQTGLADMEKTYLSGASAGDHFGISVAGAGDVNGDGYADVIIGAYRYPGGDFQGAAYIAHGSDQGPQWPPARALYGENDNDYFGVSVAGAGDVNGDGYADVIVGAHHYPGGGNQGRAYAYHGSDTGLVATPALVLSSESFAVYFGSSVASAGDVNGDGYADAIVGAYGYTDFDGKGRAYVYPGNDGGGREVLARQARADGSAMPVQAWGLTYAQDRFLALLTATDPRGRGRVKLQVEACPPGTAFGDEDCITHTTSFWADVSTLGMVTIADFVPGLSEDTPYRWRARVLYAHYTVDQPGVTPPPNPAHGPWRRWLGQAREADLRTSQPGLTVVKEVTPTTAAPGQTLTYTYRLTNSGSVSLSDVGAVDDKLGAVPLGASSLAPGAWTSGVLLYTVVEADLPGPLVNTVLATGSPPVGADVSATSSATLTLTGIALLKVASVDEANPGQTITYTYRLTNSGGVSLSGVVAVDDKLGTVTLGGSSLAPGASTTGTLAYTIVSADLPGPLVNTVVVTGAPPSGADVSARDSATVTLDWAGYRVLLPIILKNSQPY